MNLNKLRKFNQKQIKDHRFIVCIFAILMCILILYITSITNHKKNLSDLMQLLYKSDINSFNKAVMSDKSIEDSDLTRIYDNYIQKNYADFTNKKIDETTYINNLKKIRDFKNVPKKTLVTYLSKSEKYQKTQSDYSNAVKLMDNKDYKTAFNLLSSVTDLSEDYNNARKKSLDCSKIIKDETKKSITNLCSSKKFDDAEKVLSENKKYLQTGDYNELTKEMNKSKESYFNSLPNYNSENRYVNSFDDAHLVNIHNINKLGVPSETKYLIYVNTAKQTTYIFCGKKNSWTKYKEFPCSTGISDSATPTGFFKIGMKGTWFFSKKYGQGGKYWTAFKGTNYLFHSVPYDSSATKVLDSTLGTAASHGCVRLATDDSKFIHDIIPAGTSVIIN